MTDTAHSLPAPFPARPRLQPGKLCVAIQAPTPAEMLERAGRAVESTKFLEFRLDSLSRPPAILGELARFMSEHRDATAIATCRRKQNGGNFSGSLTSELDL